MYKHKLSQLLFGECHSHRDYSDGVSSVESMVDYASELGHDAISINDHGTCSGLPHHWLVANKSNQKPLLGTEGYLRLPESIVFDTRNSASGRFHLTLWSSGLVGYNNLIRLNNAAHVNIEQGRNKRFPIVTFDMLQNMDMTGIIVGTGCPASVTFHDRYDVAELYVKKLIQFFGKDNVYCEMMEHIITNDKDGSSFNCWERPLELSKIFDLQTIWTGDAHAARPHELEILRKATQAKSGYEFTANALKTQAETYDVAAKRIGHDEAYRALEGVDKLINQVQEVDLQRDFELPECPELVDYTQQLILEAFERDLIKYADELGEAVMRERLKTEWDLLDKYPKFWIYYAIIYDLVREAHEQGISTTARGSGGGSYFFYLLGVTQLNPIKHGLYFERFLCEKRFQKGELPDADIDFSSNMRHIIQDYARDKWGMMGVGTLLTYSHKSLVRFIGRVWDNVRGYKMDPIVISDASRYEAYAVDDTGKIIGKTPTFEKFCAHADFIEPMYQTMLNTISGVGAHACALAVINGDVLVPVEHFTNEPTIAYSESGAFDKFLQLLGRVKVDALGIEALGLLDLMAKMAGVMAPLEIQDGDPCFSLYNEGAVGGLFQVDTPVARQIVRANAGYINSIHDISRITASGRPGPMSQGLHLVTPENPVDVSHHPEFIQKILNRTLGVCIYQEQVMEIYASIAFSELNKETLEEGVVALKAMVPKHWSVTEQQWWIDLIGTLKNNFETGGTQLHGLTQEYIDDLWDSMKGFARYGFNLPHSLLYANLSARMAWFKYNYPEVFWTVVLNGTPNNKENMDQMIRYFVEATRFGGVTIAAPTINTADTNYTLNMDLKQVQMPLTTIKGLGPKLADKIFSERQENGLFTSLEDFVESCSPAVNMKKLLYDCGVLDDIKTGDLGADYLVLGIREEQHYSVRGKAWQDEDVVEINILQVTYSEDKQTAFLRSGAYEWTIGGELTKNKSIKGLKEGMTILAKVDGSHITKYTKKYYLQPVPPQSPRDKAIKDAYGFAWSDNLATYYNHSETNPTGLYFGFVCEIEEDRRTPATTQYSVKLESGRRIWFLKEDRTKGQWLTGKGRQACAAFEKEYEEQGLKAPYLTPGKIPNLQIGDRIGGRLIQAINRETNELMTYGQVMSYHVF